jgi:hypothetical protein
MLALGITTAHARAENRPQFRGSNMDGQRQWHKNLGTYEMRVGWGTASSPVLRDGRLFLQVDNQEQSFPTWGVTKDPGLDAPGGRWDMTSLPNLQDLWKNLLALRPVKRWFCGPADIAQ